MAVHNQTIVKARRLVYRISVNIGDIIVDGDDIQGEGINMAVWLEGIADPGGVNISASIFNQICGKLELTF